MTAEAIRLHPELSDRQRRILDFITATITRDNRSPTLREISDACGVSSTSVVSYNIDRLIERGLLVRLGDPIGARAFALPVNPWRQLVDDANYIFGLLDGVDYGGFIGGHIAGWREKRAKLIRG